MVRWRKLGDAQMLVDRYHDDTIHWGRAAKRGRSLRDTYSNVAHYCKWVKGRGKAATNPETGERLLNNPMNNDLWRFYRRILNMCLLNADHMIRSTGRGSPSADDVGWEAPQGKGALRAHHSPRVYALARDRSTMRTR